MLKLNSFVSTLKESVVRFSHQSFFDKCDTISFIFLFLFFFDCSFSGGGKLVEIGPISFRMAVAAAALVFAVPKIILKINKYIRNPLFYMFWLFLIYLLFSTWRGLRADNNMEVLLTDIKGFMWLFTVPALVVTVDTKKKFNGILNAIVAGALIQALMVLVIYFGCCLIDEGIRYFYQPMLDLQIGTVNTISKTVVRIFMRSSPYMILACSVVFFKQLKQEKLKAKYVFAISLFLFCLLFSFTRSLFGCVFVVFVCMIAAVLLFYRKKAGLMLKTLACVAASVLLVVGVLEYIFDASYLNFAVSRTLGTPVQQSLIVTAKYKIKNIDWENLFNPEETTGEDISQDDETTSGEATEKPSGEYESTTDGDSTTESEASTGSEVTTESEPTTEDDKQNQIEADNKNQQNYIEETKGSDTIRAITKQELKSLIVKNPIIGNGLGACSQTRNGPDEYFYYDMLARMGIIGLLLYVAPFMYICIYMLKKRSLLQSNMSAVALICGVFGFWAITWFNPWMNAVLGIAVYALSCSIVKVICNKQ